MRRLKAMCYGAAEVFTLGRGIPRTVGGERIRFAPRWCRYYPRDYEPETFAFLRRYCRRGTLAVDVGAHIGLFTVLMARLVGPQGRVLSYEPHPQVHAALRRHVGLNRIQSRVEMRMQAVGSQEGNGTFYCTGDECSNASSLIRTARTASQAPVSVTTLDGVLAHERAEVSCIKIDAEGAEIDVLRGAAATIRSWRPAIHLAVHPGSIRQAGESLNDLWSLLCGYRLAVFRDGKPLDERWFCGQSDLFDVQLLASERFEPQRP